MTDVYVASRADAWIETIYTPFNRDFVASRPARTRGLKPHCHQDRRDGAQSRPARTRGLKLVGLRLKLRQARRVPRGRVD